MPSVVNRRTGEKHELLAQKTTKVYHAEGEWKRLPSPDHSQGPLSLAPASVSFTSRLFSYHGGEEISFTSKLGGWAKESLHLWASSPQIFKSPLCQGVIRWGGKAHASERGSKRIDRWCAPPLPSPHMITGDESKGAKRAPGRKRALGSEGNSHWPHQELLTPTPEPHTACKPSGEMFLEPCRN